MSIRQYSFRHDLKLSGVCCSIIDDGFSPRAVLLWSTLSNYNVRIKASKVIPHLMHTSVNGIPPLMHTKSFHRLRSGVKMIKFKGRVHIRFVHTENLPTQCSTGGVAI